ncbi:MAG: hypothetical protein ACREAB_19350 [Blastocatellia bacterium]
MLRTGSKKIAATRATRVRLIKSVILFFTSVLESCYLVSVASLTQASTGEILGPPLQF